MTSIAWFGPGTFWRRGKIPNRLTAWPRAWENCGHCPLRLLTELHNLKTSHSTSMVSPSFFYVPHKVMLFCLLLNETFALRVGLWQLERQLWVLHLAPEDGCNWNCWFPTLQNVNHEFCKKVGDCRQWPKVYDLCHTQTRAILACPCVFWLENVQKCATISDTSGHCLGDCTLTSKQ